MKLSDVPKKMSVAFAVEGSRQNLQPAEVEGEPLASYLNGFPPIVMLDQSQGGLPPQGKDFNQIFYELSAAVQYAGSGGLYQFDSAFSEAIGGYPKGSIVLGSDGLTVYQSQKDSNTEDPNESTTSAWLTLAKSIGIDEDAIKDIFADATGANLIGTNNGKTVQDRFTDNETAIAGKLSEDDLSVSSAASLIGVLPQGNLAQQTSGIITPEMFGAKGDGATDDTKAVQDAVTYLINNPECEIHGRHKYALSGTVYLYGFSVGARIHLRSVVAHANFPALVKWQEGTPFFVCGYPGFESAPVGLNFTVDYVNGGGKADVMHWSYYGIGGSTFNIGVVYNCNNTLMHTNGQFPMSSNKVFGNYWYNCSGQAFRLGKTAEYPDNATCEATIIDVGFITGFSRGAYHLRTSAMYTNIRGESDFNGRFVQKLYFDADIGAHSGDTITYDSTSFYVIANTNNTEEEFGLLVDAGQDVSTTAAIPNGAAITFNGNSYTVAAIKLPSTDNWYPDIIHDYWDSAGIAKCLLWTPYCGGIEGTYLFSDNINIGNSNVGAINQMAGNSFYHSGETATWKDAYLNREIFSSQKKFIYTGNHLNMRDYALHGTFNYLNMQSGVSQTIRTFAKIGDGFIPEMCERYEIFWTSNYGPARGYGIITVDTDAIYWDLINGGDDNIAEFSIDGMNFNVVQNLGGSAFVLFTGRRVF